MADIIDITTPWEGKTGREVESFIKGSLNAKHGASYFDAANNTMLYFATKEDMTEWLSSGNSELVIDEAVMNFTGTMYQIKVQNEMPSKNLYFTTKEDKAEITVSFASQKKGITDVSWMDFVEDYNVSVYVDKGSTGAFTPLIVDQFVMSGKTFTFDVKKVLATGVNRVRVVAVGTESADKAQGSEMFIVNLTSMYLSPSNFTWYKPFIEGETYSLGGMNIGGNLNKSLKVKMTKEGYEKLYEVAIGSDIYTTTAYVFKGLEFPSGGTGVYNVDIWLDANGLESDHLSYNIICVSQADKFTAQLVAIGDPAKTVYNFSDNKLFEYCVYNGGTATATPHIKIAYVVNTNPTTIINEDLVDVATAAPLTYTASLEIEMEDESAALQLETLMTYGNEQVFVFPVDNSKSYPATTGAVFYMNPSARNNAQSNREKVINSITGAEIDAVFTRMAWTDGTDGWTTDEEGRKCLKLPAGCPMEMDYSPLASVSQKTIELVYKVKNAADYDEPIFSICSDVNDPNFRGIVIRPKNILVHSRDLNTNDSLQDYNTTDEETLHVLITIIPNYKTNYGNLLQIYCNGDKVRSFSFETADRWDTPAKVKFGSMTADTYWYKFRDYNRGFETSDASKNVTNAQPNTKAKAEMKAWLEAPLDDSYKLSYDECVKNGLNTMVVEILGNDQTIPSIATPSAKQCNLWVKINNPIDGELDSDFTGFFGGEAIEDQTIEGQGTTAMTYARWNFRWKLGSAYNKRRITAKKNFASSMQSHKMGATRLFNDLNRAIVGPNDADSRVAVYQYPVYGFQKIRIEGTEDYMYGPIGLYTIGPDKGDKKTFGFDGEYESTLIHLEGTDHTPKGVGFDYPYEELGYSGSAEALGAINATGAVVAAWECGAAGEYDPKDNPTEVKAMLDAEFKPAYDVAEKNSTYILGVTETLAEMNANISAWQAKKDAEGRSYADLQFFTDGVYDLYFYNTRTQQYAPRGINMLTDLGVSVDGLSLDEKTELFKTKRRERFVANWETYWHKNDAIFHYAFVLLFGATDNFKKNTYPYKYKPFSEGGVYRWRQDDLDTLFDINNQGLAAKIYSILVGDKTETGSGSIYRGDTSAFWTLIKECFPTEIKAMVHAIFDKMVELSPYGNNTLEKLVGCIRYYFWDKAQAYFPASAYSKDAEWTYEDTWAAGLYKEVNPLQQSLGGHKEAEIDWVTMRMLFCAMYFNYGPFGAVNDSFSDTSTGQIAYGGAGAKTYVITMACDGNPTILRGQSELVTYGDRVKAGETIELTVPDSSGADTRIYIQGVDWMEDIGDLSDLQVSADNPQLSVASKRLQRLKVGDEDASKVTTTVQALNFGECPSMIIVDARNAKSLTGTIDLSKMPRLMEAYFGGTGVKAVNVPNGSKIAVLELGEETTQISLMNLKFMGLEGLRYSELPKLEYLRIENCSQLNPFTMLKEIYNTEGNVIRDIRIIGFDVDGDASDVTMIANLANDVDKDGNPHIYNGIDAEGKPMDNSHPIIEGRLRINGNIYEDDYQALKAVFSNLVMEFLGFYVAIKDPEVLRVLLEKITTDDGVGLTIEDIEGVKTMGNWWRDNTVITSFAELKRFGLTTIGESTFNGCVNLATLELPTTLTRVLTGTFYKVPANFELHMPNAASNALSASGGAFARSGVTKVVIGGEATSIEGNYNIEYLNGVGLGAFSLCNSLTEVVLPSTLTKLGVNSFASCPNLVKMDLPEGLLTIDDSALTSSANLIVPKLPKSLTSIGKNNFYQNGNMPEDIDLPNLLGTLGASFMKTNIKRILNLGSITSTGSSPVYYPTNSGAGPFSDCKELVFVELPETLTTIGIAAFAGCNSLETIVVRNPTPASWGAKPFSNTNSTFVFFVPDESVEAYKTATNWSQYSDRIYPLSVYEAGGIENVITFADPAVEAICLANFDTDGNGVLMKSEAEAVTSLGMKFNSNTEITSFMELAQFGSVNILASNEFKACSNLESIDLSNIKNIDKGAFMECSNLTNYGSLENVEILGDYAFNRTAISGVLRMPKLITLNGTNGNTLAQTNITNIADLGRITEIPAYFFRYSTNLEKVTIPDSVISIQRDAFAFCQKLKTLIIGEGIESIANGVLWQCTAIKSIVCKAVTPPLLAEGFIGTNSTFSIYVPDSSVEEYKAATNWSGHASVIKPLSEYTE